MAFLGEQYFKMSNAIFVYGLTPIQLSVYFYLCRCAGQRGSCWPSMQTIANCCGCSKNAARSAVQKLDELGFIRMLATYEEHEGVHRQTNNTYFILELPPSPEKRARRRLYKSSGGKLTDDPEVVLP